MEVQWTSPAVCSVGGLVIDVVGACFLAYDTVMGPGARFQAKYARVRLEGVRTLVANQYKHVEALPDPPYPPEEKAAILAREVPPLQQLVVVAEKELEMWEAHEDRAQSKALLGLLLLMLGFTLQGVGVVLGIIKG